MKIWKKKRNNTMNLREKVFKKFEEWCKESSGQGIPNIVRKNTASAKLIWIVFTLASVGLCGYMISRSVNQYLEYEVTTKIRKEIKSNVPFPVISICNKTF
jgi:hypothetical protein